MVNRRIPCETCKGTGRCQNCNKKPPANPFAKVAGCAECTPETLVTAGRCKDCNGMGSTSAFRNDALAEKLKGLSDETDAG